MSITISADPSGTFGTIEINGVPQIVVNSDGSLKTPAGKVIATSEGILGVVSQAAGVPTGAVIERGSNANGEYTKFADGTLICTLVLSSVSSVFTQYTSTIWRSPFSWTYPSTFIGAPSGLASTGTSTYLITTGGLSVTSTGIEGRVVAFEAVGTIPCNLFFTAIGRWF